MSTIALDRENITATGNSALNKVIRALSYYYLARRFLNKLRPNVKAMARNRAAFYAQAWEIAAAQTGSQIRSLGGDIYEITNGGRSVRVCLNYSPFDDCVTLQLAGNKPAVYGLLAEAEVPIPRYAHLSVLDMSVARTFLSQSDRPVVVKPAYGTGAGQGITTNITTIRQLYQAVAWASAFCSELVLEEQIEGDNYRLLFLDGELLDCIVRWPPRLVGDGVSSIRRLIGRENEERVRSGLQLGQTLIPLDLDTKNTLAAQGMRLRTVPDHGQVVRVKDVINCNRAEENENPKSRIAEPLIALGRKISDIIGTRLVGIDIITNNLEIDLHESGGAVIDVNTTPGFYYHHLKKDHRSLVSVQVLQRALEDRVERARSG